LPNYAYSCSARVNGLSVYLTSIAPAGFNLFACAASCSARVIGLDGSPAGFSAFAYCYFCIFSLCAANYSARVNSLGAYLTSIAPAGFNLLACAASYSARDIPAPPKLLTALGGALGGPRDPPLELGTEDVGGGYSAGFGTLRGLHGSFVGLGFPVDVPAGGAGGFCPFFQAGGYGMTGFY